jgi:hypothetical protein
VTEDVLEHVFNPTAAFKEISRTLRPGGAHVFTVPLMRESLHSSPRAIRYHDGSCVMLQPPDYHGTPADSERSPVTIDLDFVICQMILSATGLSIEIYIIDDLSQGIRAKYI